MIKQGLLYIKIYIFASLIVLKTKKIAKKIILFIFCKITRKSINLKHNNIKQSSKVKI
jgi:hypothetical protein